MTNAEAAVESIETMALDAGWLALDFANTANWHASEQPIEYLNTYADLLTFGRRAHTLTAAEAQRLAAAAAARPAEAARALRQAVAVREALYNIFSAVARAATPEAADMELLNQFLSGALAQARVVAKAEGLAWGWADAPALDRMLWPVAQSAADLLTTAESLARVGQCADDRGCGWLFYDTSRNHSRRWCAMKDCGNRAKARRHYRRQKQTRLAAGV